MSVAGCSPSADPLVPTNVGVVVKVEHLEGRGRTHAYHLETGEVVEIDFGAANILGGPGGPGEGNLLLSGTETSGRTWLLGLPLQTAGEARPGCFRLIATGTGVDGWIDISNGLRLKKAAGFDPGPNPSRTSAMPWSDLRSA